jgi:hypothetical protein
MLLIDGGGAGRRSSSASPPAPPPPPPKRVAEAPVSSSQGSSSNVPDTAEQQREPLAAAAQNTQQKVAAAAQANTNVTQLERLPSPIRNQLQVEIAAAKSDAGHAKTEARKAVHDELAVAKKLMSPAYYEDYSAAMDRDFSGNADEAAVVREAKVATASPTTAKPGATDASLAKIEAKQAEVQKAETRYNETARSVENLPTHIKDLVMQPLYATREAKRAELAELIEADLSAAAKQSPRHPYDDQLASRAAQINAIAPGNAHFAAAVAEAQQRVADTRATDAAVASVENVYNTKGAVAAAEELSTQAAWMTPSQAAMLNDRASETIDRITADIGKSTNQDDINRAVKGLSAAAEKGGAKSAEQIAESLARGFSDGGVSVTRQGPRGATYQSHDYKLDDALKAAVAGGSGTALAVATADELRSAGRVDAADRIDQAVVDGVDKLRKDYADVQKTYAQREIQLQRDLANFGPGLTAEQRADYVKAYWADETKIKAADSDDLPSNAEVKRQFEAGDDKLANALTAATPTLERLAREGDENAGEVLLDGYEALARSPEHAEKSIDWMQHVNGDAELFGKLDGFVNADLKTRFADGISADGISSMSSKLLVDLTNAPDKATADRLFNEFIDKARTVGTSKGYLDNIKDLVNIRETTDKLKDFAKYPAGSPQRIALEKDIGTRAENLLKGWSEKSKLGKSLAVVGIVVGLADANQAFKDGKIPEGIIASIGVGKGAAEIGIGILGTLEKAGKVSGSFAKGAAEFGAKMLPLIGLGLDVAQAYDDGKQLSKDPNAGEVIAGIGTLVSLAGDVAEFVPFAGTLVGGILGAVGSLLHGIGGFIDGLIEGGDARNALEARQKSYLDAAKIDKATAEAFVEKPYEISLLENFDMSPAQVQSLATQLNADYDKYGEREVAFRCLSATAAAYGLTGDAAANFIGEAFKMPLEQARNLQAPMFYGHSNGIDNDKDAQIVKTETATWLRENLPDVYQRYFSGSQTYPEPNTGYFNDYTQLHSGRDKSIAGKDG